MKLRLALLLSLSLLLFTVAPAHAQNFTTVTANNIQDVVGHPIASASLCIIAVDPAGNHINFGIGGGGQVTNGGVLGCVGISNGAIVGPLNLPNPSHTNPEGVLYDFSVWQGQTEILDYPLVGFEGANFNFDLYSPGVPPVPWGGGVVNGNQVVNGDLNVTGNVTCGSGCGGGSSLVYVGVLSGIPATCTVSQISFITDATAGQNLYYCTASNTWTQELNSGGGGSTAFSALTGSTNTTAAMHVGTGASLDATGSGAVHATTAAALAAAPSLCSTGQAPTGIAANGNATGCAAIGGGGSGWYVSSQSVQWVSALGLDTNDGLSIATAKLTWDAACVALSGGSASPASCGTGTIYVIGTVAANPNSSYGRWLMGPSDVNYSSPPAGWYRYSGPIRTVCAGGANPYTNNGSIAPCTVSGGTSTPGYPGLWLSSLTSFEDDHIAVENYIATPVRLGLDSTGNRASGSGATSIYLRGIGINTGACYLGGGPSIDIGSLSFYIYIDHAAISGCPGEDFTGSLSRSSGVVTFITSATNDFSVGMTATVKNSTDPSFNGSFVVTAVSGSPQTQVQWSQSLPNSTSAGGELHNFRGAAIAMNPGTGVGGEALFISDSVLNDGGIWFTAGVGGGAELSAKNIVYEGNPYGPTAPAVLITIPGAASKIQIDHLSAADSSTPTYSVEVDNGCLPDAVVVTAVDSPVSGCATVNGVEPEIFGSLTQSPSVSGQVGVMGGQLYGQTDAGVRLFSPSTVRYANMATEFAPSSWTYLFGSGTITLGVAAPDGTGGAGKFTSSSGQSTVAFYIANQSLTVGDYYVYGAWVQTVGAAGAGSNPLEFVLSGAGNECSTNSTQVLVPPFSGQGEWFRVWGVCKVAGASGTASVELIGISDTTHTGAFYAPTIFRITSGSLPDDEVWALASNMSFYPPSCAVGQPCLPSGPVNGVLNHSGTVTAASHTIQDTATLSTGTVTVTLTGAGIFTGATTYSCSANDTTTPANAVGITQTSGTTITFTAVGASDVIVYSCVGH